MLPSPAPARQVPTPDAGRSADAIDLTAPLGERLRPAPLLGRPLGTRAVPRRIFMTTGSDEASWDHCLELASALGRCGIEVALATLGASPALERLRESLRLTNLKVFPGRFSEDWETCTWDELQRASDWLLQLEQLVEPDLVHLHHPIYGSSLFRAPKLISGDTCPLCHWRAAHRDDDPRWRRFRKAVAHGISGAEMLVTPTAATLLDITGHFGPPRTARVIPDGRSPRGVAPGAKGEIVLSRACPGDPRVNVEALDDAARSLPWRVVVTAAGPAAEPENGKRNGSGAPAGDGGLRWLSGLRREQRIGWLGRASVFALPCRLSPSGLPVLEAALAGCALVLGDVPSLRETWEGAALFVDPGSAKDLRRGLELLIAEPKGLHGLARRARGRALALTPERRAAAFLEAYTDLLTGAREAPEVS